MSPFLFVYKMAVRIVLEYSVCPLYENDALFLFLIVAHTTFIHAAMCFNGDMIQVVNLAQAATILLR